MPEATRDDFPILYTVAEVADWLRVSKMTIYRMIDAGEIRVLRVGHSVRVPASEITRVLESDISDKRR
jgi:excisionase family DNA binding protein